MAATDPDPRMTAAMMGWPEPWQSWYGGEYPSRRAVLPLRGWVCSGCGRGFAPHVRSCDSCGPQDQPATVGVSRRLGPDDPMSDEDYER